MGVEGLPLPAAADAGESEGGARIEGAPASLTRATSVPPLLPPSSPHPRPELVAAASDRALSQLAASELVAGSLAAPASSGTDKSLWKSSGDVTEDTVDVTCDELASLEQNVPGASSTKRAPASSSSFAPSCWKSGCCAGVRPVFFLCHVLCSTRDPNIVNDTTDRATSDEVLPEPRANARTWVTQSQANKQINVPN